MSRKPPGYWTNERIINAAAKYSTKKAFRAGDNAAWDAACRNPETKKIACAHMTMLRRPNGYWTDDRLREEALKYKSRFDFVNGSEAAYHYAKRKQILDWCCEHMGEKNPTGFSITEAAVLYYLRVETESGTLWKIGVTKSIKSRHYNERTSVVVLNEWAYDTGRKALDAEKEILSKFAAHRYTGPDVLTSGGNTELFTKDVLRLDVDMAA